MRRMLKHRAKITCTDILLTSCCMLATAMGYGKGIRRCDPGYTITGEMISVCTFLSISAFTDSAVPQSLCLREYRMVLIANARETPQGQGQGQ